jgi:predicted  nucleic acid-binding Zn-ribbon protein
MDEAEKAARVAELEHELTALTLECQKLTDELHVRRERAEEIERLITKLRGDSTPDRSESR